MFVSFKKYGAIAQLGEHLPCKQGAEGSSPSSSTLRFRLALRSWVTEERNDRLPIDGRGNLSPDFQSGLPALAERYASARHTVGQP